MNKADFEKIARYTSESWRGKFTKREIKENAKEMYSDYIESKQNKYVNAQMQVLCENMVEDMDYYNCEDYADCDNTLGEDIETMEKVLNDYMEFMER